MYIYKWRRSVERERERGAERWAIDWSHQCIWVSQTHTSLRDKSPHLTETSYYTSSCNRDKWRQVEEWSLGLTRGMSLLEFAMIPIVGYVFFCFWMCIWVLVLEFTDLFIVFLVIVDLIFDLIVILKKKKLGSWYGLRNGF